MIDTVYIVIENIKAIKDELCSISNSFYGIGIIMGIFTFLRVCCCK